jgi:hypothetical protein
MVTPGQVNDYVSSVRVASFLCDSNLSCSLSVLPASCGAAAADLIAIS